MENKEQVLFEALRESTKEEPSIRKKAIERLGYALTNPGLFSVLILGERGTGKNYWIQEICRMLDKHQWDCMNSMAEYSGEYLSTIDYSSWLNLLGDANNGLLVINDIEQLSISAQDILFRALSTDQNGNVGLAKKTLKIRPVFTSASAISQLRTSKNNFSNKLFDRIAQLIIEFPSLTETKEHIEEDFHKVWNNMKFSGPPAGFKIDDWLKENIASLKGNFRDLEKLAIVFENELRMGKTQSEINEYIDKHFLSHHSYPEKDAGNLFNIDNSETYEVNLANFRKQFIKYFIKCYETPATVQEKADIKESTYYRMLKGQ